MRGKRMEENLVEKEVEKKVLKKIEISWGDLKSFEYYIMFFLWIGYSYALSSQINAREIN